MKPVCVPCQMFFRPKKTGFYFTEGMPIDTVEPAPPGTEAPEKWEPYKLWVGDLWECRGCGTQIVVGVAGSPISEHYMEDFHDMQQRLNGQWQVNDY